MVGAARVELATSCTPNLPTLFVDLEFGYLVIVRFVSMVLLK